MMRLVHNFIPRSGTVIPLLVSVILLACQLIPGSTPTPEPTRALISTPEVLGTPTLSSLATLLPLPTDTPLPVLATANENLNIRSAPATTAQILGRLNKGGAATVMGRNAASDWWQIALPNDPAGRGWIAAAYTTVEGPADQVAVVSAVVPPKSTTAAGAKSPTRPVTPLVGASTPTNTPGALTAAPTLVQPQGGASYAAAQPVILTWTWSRAIASGEFYQIQLAKQGSELKDLGCTTLLAHQINPPAPQGAGSYQWRVLVRRGSVQGCVAQGDVSQASETRAFEWRAGPTPTSPAYP